MVYIDKALCFVKNNYGEQKNYLSYYSSTQSSVSKGGSTGAGLNLGAVTGALGVGGAFGTLAGGVTVGGSSTKSSSTTYGNERILMIPPHGRVVFSKQDFEKIDSKQFVVKSVGENFANPTIAGIETKMIGSNTYTEDESPRSKSYMITYSITPDFKNTKIMNFSVYVKETAGFHSKVMTYDNFVKKYTQGVDDYTIIIGYTNW